MREIPRELGTWKESFERLTELTLVIIKYTLIKVRYRNQPVSLTRFLFRNNFGHSNLQIMNNWNPKILQFNVENNLSMGTKMLLVEDYKIKFF